MARVLQVMTPATNKIAPSEKIKWTSIGGILSKTMSVTWLLEWLAAYTLAYWFMKIAMIKKSMLKRTLYKNVLCIQNILCSCHIGVV
jgi:hypothetical protein